MTIDSRLGDIARKRVAEILLTAYVTIGTFYTMKITRRIGPDPHANGAQTSSCQGCPDILELEDGDFAIIGVDITALAAEKLAFGASCGPDERIIKIPRKTLVLAKTDIPESV